MLSNKTVVLGVTGSIAAYKAADLASKLVQAGAKVQVVMTDSATRFIPPLTLRAITNNAVVTDMFEAGGEVDTWHIPLAEQADVVVIAPATANIIAKLACGIADDMLTCVVLATQAPVIVAPGMNDNMYKNAVTQENIARLKAKGFTFIDPEYGRLVSGKIGTGRLADVETIIGSIRQVLGRKGDLAGKHIVVTAGGTQEAIDPVRVITNRSSGKMGYSLAEAARDRGATVTLISAPTALPKPAGVEFVPVVSAAEMKRAVERAVANADALIMAAAVADFQPKRTAKGKIKKESATGMTLELVKTPDILSEVKGSFLKVGFAAESENVVANARKKLQKKNLDLIVANNIAEEGSGFNVDTNRVTIIDRSGKAEDLPLMSKREVAERVLERVGEMMLPEELVIAITRGSIKHYCFDIFSNERKFFPDKPNQFILVTDIGEINTKLAGKDNGIYIQQGLKKWYEQHPEIKEGDDGDKVVFKVIEPMEKYRLEIVK